MKRSLLAFRWFIASLLFGVVAVGIFIVCGVYLPAHTAVISEAVSRRALLTGLTIWVFLIGVPLIALILAIREVATGNSSAKNLANK